jgi:peroxiredoxin Q/BCP
LPRLGRAHKIEKRLSRSGSSDLVNSPHGRRTIEGTHDMADDNRLSEGDANPGFALADSAGAVVRPEDFAGRRLVVYFYPAAFTSGCTTEACDFRDNLASLQGNGYDVIGISPDGPEALAKFTGEFALTFPLLSDEDHSVALAYGAWGEKLVDGEIVEGLVRSTVVLDGEGTVKLTQYQVSAQGHVQALKEELGV